MMDAKELELKLSDALQREDILKEKLAESQREFRAADATIENLQMQVAKLATVNELFLRAKALMHQSGGKPIENSLNPIDAWLYDAERAAAAGKGE